MIEQTVKDFNTDAKRLPINGVEYYRYTGADALEDGEGDGIILGDMTSFAIKADSKLTADEIHGAVKILSYFWKKMVRGNESLTEWLSVDDDTVVFNHGIFEDGANSSLSQSGHPRYRFAQLVLDLNKKLSEGTTRRTHGTRLHDGITRFENGVNSLISFSVWVDAVEQTKIINDEVVEEVKIITGRDVLIPKKQVVNTPAWEAEPESYIGKDAGDLTFNEVKELLAALKTAHKRAEDAETKASDLQVKLDNIRALVK